MKNNIEHHRQRSREYYYEHREKILADARRRYATDSSLRERRKAYTRQYWLAHPEKQRTLRQKPSYRVAAAARTRRWYEQHVMKRQDQIATRPRTTSCEICGMTGKIVFDHDHNTGKFRGWICDRCNKAIGLMHDEPLLVTKILEYLTNFKKDD